MTNIIEVKDTTTFEEFYKGSYYTIIGAGGDLKEWAEGYNDFLNKEGIGQLNTMYHFTGEQMNEYYDLTGNNRYDDELNFLAFPLDGLNHAKLAIFKLRMGDSWFDDIVDNNRSREEA